MEAIYKNGLGPGLYLWHQIPDVHKLGSLTVGAPSFLGLVFLICPMFPCASFLCLLPLAFLYLCPTVVLFSVFFFLKLKLRKSFHKKEWLSTLSFFPRKAKKETKRVSKFQLRQNQTVEHRLFLPDFLYGTRR